MAVYEKFYSEIIQMMHQIILLYSHKNNSVPTILFWIIQVMHQNTLLCSCKNFGAPKYSTL
jgi:hypothetical protein